MKALFFLRHYNDIDHITPVITQWVAAGHHCDVVLIGAFKFRHDYRINYLATLDCVRVAHVRELFPLWRYWGWRLQMLLLTRNIRRSILGPLIIYLASVFGEKQREPLWRKTASYLLARSFAGANHGVVVFDWIERNSVIAVEWVETVIMLARSQGMETVSLPHGDSPHATQLIRRGEWRLGPDVGFAAAKIFDRVVVPNALCSQRFLPFLGTESLAILGSPRYCEAWLSKLSTLMPPSPLSANPDKLKIVMFLRKANFTTFWEEVNEVVHMLAAFPQVTLIIKPHTRTGWKQSLTSSSALKKLANVSVAGDDTHSIHLMNWADVCIDLATSVVFEAVRRGQPVLAADYLHASRSAVAVYMPETELRCRDDVFEKINHFLEHGYRDFYVPAHRERFLTEMLDVGGPEVLPRYVRFLEGMGHDQKEAISNHN